MRRLQARYSALRARLGRMFATAITEAGVDTTHEAALLAERFGVSRKKRATSQYADLTSHLLSHYPSEVAYFIAVEINEQFESRLGYPPIGQIMVAMEEHGGERAVRWIACALRNFPRIEAAQLAFGVIRSVAIRSLVRSDLAAEDSELAEYICTSRSVAPHPKPALPQMQSPPTTDAEPNPSLSDGIERMPRRLTEEERRGDRLYLHLQVSSFVLLLLLPILGGVLSGWIGAGIGLVVGWFARVWIRRSMGLRGSNPHDGFFIRMRERANGARRGLLEALIERVRRRSFTQKQCAAMTQAWDDTRQRLAATKSAEEKRALMKVLDADIKRISYGVHE
jgi:hypothetical protein